jgi:hypothetical protein
LADSVDVEVTFDEGLELRVGEEADDGTTGEWNNDSEEEVNDHGDVNHTTPINPLEPLALATIRSRRRSISPLAHPDNEADHMYTRRIRRKGYFESDEWDMRLRTARVGMDAEPRNVFVGRNEWDLCASSLGPTERRGGIALSCQIPENMESHKPAPMTR